MKLGFDSVKRVIGINKIYTLNDNEVSSMRESLHNVQYYLQDIESDIESADTKESVKQALASVYSIYKIIGM